MILTDNETKVDLLNNEAVAATIIKLLIENGGKPVTIGVHGDWGAGKSSILEMIESGLEGEEDILCLKFNGWRFQGFEDAKIALIESIVNGLIEKRPALTKAGVLVKDLFRRIDWLKVAKHAGSLAITAHTGIPNPDQVHAAVGILNNVIADPQKYITKEGIEQTVDGIKSAILTKEESKSIPEEITAFRKDFDELLRQAKIKQLVVLVDDLDRCLPETAIETLEAIRLFVFTSQTAFVIGADEAMIEYAVRKHFPDLPDTSGPQTYARNYLEKLIQVPFRIPALGETETRIYVTLLLIGAELGEDDENFVKLIAVARERLKRPWKTDSLDAATVTQALGDKADRVNNALTLSDQIARILASGTKGNPRQIKRFLNALVLRKRTADARGFGDEVQLPILAKLMLAERFIFPLFDNVATTAATTPDGICLNLNSLEQAVQEHSEVKISEASKAPKASVSEKENSENTILSGWLSSESICAWAAIEPKLTGVDLRPYLFVTKDRKDYFGSTSVLGKLATVVEQLLGPKMVVQALTQDIKRLTPVEASQIFESLRSRIMGGGTFNTQPSGVEGLIVLVSAHSGLQANLLDFLESLPTDKIGAWVVGGWGSVVKDVAITQRLDQLLQGWANVNNNQMLKVAAATTLKARKGSR